ncbi:ferritin family protein [Chloroflexota bacterium]
MRQKRGLKMPDELAELFDEAMYKEVASQAFYIAGQEKTDDPGAKSLMKELAEAEHRHLEMLKEFKEEGWKEGQWHAKKIQDLKMSEYLIGSDELEWGGLQDTLIIAMKREQHAMEFYSRMMSVLRDEDAKLLCERLVHEELKHKQRLEIFYDDLFYRED